VTRTQVRQILQSNTGAFVGNEGGSQQSWFDPMGDGANIGRGVDKGGIRPAAGKSKKKQKLKKL
jgi:hypothetical protein